MKNLSRRTVLRGGLGAALALPLLEVMMPRRASAAEASIPQRFLVWSQPNGTVMDNWRPISGSGGERDFTLSRILAPFEPYKSDMLIVQNLEQKDSYGHHYITGLTGRAARDTGYPALYATGISVDQYIANAWAGRTAIPSLQLGIDIVDGGTTSCVSWAGDNRPMPPESNPFAVYSRLFGNGVPNTEDPAAMRRLSRRMSVIDSVKTQVDTLNKRLGTTDRQLMDNYLESVRAIERELGTLIDRKGQQCVAPDIGDVPPGSNGEDYWFVNENAPALLRLQSRLAAAAFACDLTRVITLNVSQSGGAFRTYNFLDGVPKDVDLHGLSHNVEVGVREPLTLVDIWHAKQLKLLLDDLKNVVTPDDQTLLYHSLVFSNNEYGPNGEVDFLPPHPHLSGERANLSHYTTLMPYVFFGQAGGMLSTGRNLECAFEDNSELAHATAKGQAHTKLLVSILNTLGFSDQSFGGPQYAQGPLDGFLI